MLIVLPGSEGVLSELFPGFFPFDILLDRFAKNPVGSSATNIGQTLDAGFGLGIELETCGGSTWHGDTGCYL